MAAEWTHQQRPCQPSNAELHQARNETAFVSGVSFDHWGVATWNAVSGRTHAKRNEWRDLLSTLGTGARVNIY